MSAKTERITILGTPEFKAWLGAEADREGLSVSELVRRRVMSGEPAEAAEEEVLGELIAEVRRATRKAETSLTKGLASAEAVLAELRERRR